MNAASESRFDALAERLGDIATRHGVLARYSAAGVGGPADVLVVATNRDELRHALTESRSLGLPVKVFGGLTNCLISDAGLEGVIVLNHARAFRFVADCSVYAESGAMVVQVARAAVERGWGGLTWAVGLPGTIGGMVVNNAGAFGGETSRVLESAEVLDRQGTVAQVECNWFGFRYRCSKLKGAGDAWVVLSASFRLKPGNREFLLEKAEEYTRRRRHTQPPGRTLGSTFKNPEGDFAGRLIEAAGLKGWRVGGVVVSTHHANFFINEGEGTTTDYVALIRFVRKRVFQQFGVLLEPEIEFIGRGMDPTAWFKGQDLENGDD
ncbi:MAG: UDP-N-acetylmuramate dehydrogenase [Anaerolineae bacterium]|nr:UDP-N-acetylmuramate dehydrogenase [Anaerolineae bacterium]